ncbi:rhodanese-like domain-containing protein [Streptosporangium carneum]|uniref:Sulfurtransferase n=1 Tax=Streptosporangium carneum TaxID=47481 RepID=A0A9W6I2W3_9ACTN|nr:rhodanese-like domain-containing protein [Streptosporangium carneum]GLK10274.1 sulfurtransferase [Streptosporangium carneum]
MILSSTVDVASARALTASGSGVLLLDVRTPAEFETAHIEGAVNLPLDRLDESLPLPQGEASGGVVLVCQSGGRARTAQAKLASAGVRETAVLAGGMGSWIASGAPVVRGRQRWSLERQVRLVAGLLVLVSVVASLWVPWALLVTGFVGAGLTYAGASDNCMMGMLLARLPYNRGTGTGTGADVTGAPGRACPR